MGMDGEHAEPLVGHTCTISVNAFLSARRVGSAPVRRIALITASLCLVLVAASCNHDGRYLRPANPDQNATISTTAAPSTTVAGDAFGTVGRDANGGGIVDGGIVDGGIVSTVSPGLGEQIGTDVPTTAAILPGTTTGKSAGATGDVLLAATAPWRDGAAVPTRYTCDGDNVAPALAWPTAPANTSEIAITMVDEQNPGFVHWTLGGIDATSTSLGEGALPVGAFQGVNGGGSIGYTGPCPPAGTTHTYLITVHYLGQQLELGDGAAGVDMLTAIDASTLQSAEVTGTFSRA
jgi:Raf kinase inhibitor-like YbhB/YbcL family protein